MTPDSKLALGPDRLAQVGCEAPWQASLEAGVMNKYCLSLQCSALPSIHWQSQIKTFKMLLSQMNPLPNPGLGTHSTKPVSKHSWRGEQETPLCCPISTFGKLIYLPSPRDSPKDTVSLGWLNTHQLTCHMEAGRTARYQNEAWNQLTV